MSRIILTGGSGFLGANIATELERVGHELTIVDIDPKALSIMAKLEAKKALADFRDFDKLKSLLKGQDILIHFACSSLPGTPFEKMAEDICGNVADSVKLFKLAQEAGVKLIVFPSSGGTVYGNAKSLPVKEDTPTNPICSYGITKLAIEKYLYLFHHLFNLDYLVLRIGNPYGPGQNPNGQQGLIAKFLEKINKGDPITVFGGGQAVRDFIYVADVAAAFSSAINAGLKNDVYNVGTGIGHSVNEIIELTAKVLKVTPKVVHSDRRSIDVEAIILDHTKLSKALDWSPQVRLEEGLNLTNTWIKEAAF